MIVVDASVVVSAVLDSGPTGRWSEAQLRSGVLVAPEMLLAEVGNLIRRAETVGHVGRDLASLAYGDAVDLPVRYLPYRPFAARIWELRGSVASYDAWYVAVAESTASPMVTLDRRLAKAAGPGCRFILPPG